MAHHEHHDIPPGKRKEWRFYPEPTTRGNYLALVGGLGALLLGAGAYSQWYSEPPHAYAPTLFVLGTIGLAIAAFLGDPGSIPLRVGASGVTLERAGEPAHLAWCDVERIALEGGRNVVVSGAGKTVLAGLPHHAVAAAFIVQEGSKRIANKVSIDAITCERLTRRAEGGGTPILVDARQLAGRKCKSSATVIAFEDDARECQQCGQVYHRDHAPDACVTCASSLSTGHSPAPTAAHG